MINKIYFIYHNNNYLLWYNEYGDLSMNYNLNLNLLKYFYEVVNEKNITRASEKLLISQPAITKAIKELESELNTKLLERNKKGCIPTVEGAVLYEHIKDIFNNLNSTLNIIEVKQASKNLYIGATTTNFIIFLKDALKKFRNTFPNIHINIVLEEMDVLNELSKLGKLDIVIKNNYEKIDNFKCIKSFSINDKFVASSKYFPELKKRVFSLNELISNYPFVLLSDITHGRKNFDNYLKKLNINFKPTYEFNSYSLCRELIKDGFGIGIGNPIHYNTDEYIIINTDFSLPTRTFNIGYISSSKNEIISKFIEYI